MNDPQKRDTMEKKACSKKQQNVSLGDLPLSCPMPGQAVWNAHPKVYLDIEKTGEVFCPYCETHYILPADAK